MSVLITAAEMVTALGSDKKLSFDAMLSGAVGVAELQGMAFDGYKTTRGYQVPWGGAEVAEPQERAAGLLEVVLSRVVGRAGVRPGARVKAIIGTGLRNHRELERAWSEGRPYDRENLNFEPVIRDVLGAGVPMTILTNACSASLFALGLGKDAIDQDEADVVVVAGVDTIAESMFALLDRVSPSAPDAIQPFQVERPGVLMGEAAAAIVLERDSGEARAEGRAQGLLRGVGMSSDAKHETAPSVEGLMRSMNDAYRRSGVCASEIDLVMAHGTGTVLNDDAEGEALRQAFEDNKTMPILSAIKSQLGHSSGASGLVGVVTALQCLKSGRVPPIVGLSEPIASVRGFRLPASGRIPMKVAQVNAFGFGGVNAVAVVSEVL